MAEELLKDLEEFDRIEDQYLSQIFAESGATINACNIVVFAKQKEAEAYATKRDGNKKSHRKLW